MGGVGLQTAVDNPEHQVMSGPGRLTLIGESDGNRAGSVCACFHSRVENMETWSDAHSRAFST